MGRHPVILAVLAVLAIGQTGCQNGFLGGCGGKCFGLNGLRERVFPRTVGCCGGELGSEAAPLVYGNPGAISVAPTSPMGTVIPGATPAPSSIDSLPGSTLDPIPSGSAGPPPGASDASMKDGAKGTAGKAAYEAQRPRNYKQGGGSTLARSLTSSPEPTPRSAQGLSSSSRANETNPLDNLEPLDLPEEVTQSNPSKVPAEPSEKPPTATPGPAPAADTLGGSAPAPAPALPASVTAEMTVSPGIRYFAGVDSKLAGGSLPSSAGLDWLVEMGYRTVLDLREPSEIPPTFAPEVTKRGMNYHSLPISMKTIDAEHMAKFQAELAEAKARPLYFCDTDGNRAGVLWFVRRITVDKVNPQVARDDAKDLGLNDTQWWKAANDYLDKLKTASHMPSPTATESKSGPTS